MATVNIYDMADTWNNVATTYTAIKMNVTDTASASGSLLMDLQVGGSSRITIRKDGFTQLNGTSASLAASSCGVATNGPGLFTTGTNLGGYLFGASNDLFLTRRAAASLRLGAADAASPVAQTLGVQSVVAGTTNTAGANFTIAGSQGTGSGAGGSIIFQVAPAGSSGTAQNALATALTINSASQLILPLSSLASAPGYTFDNAKAGIGYIGTTLRFVGGSNDLWANLGAGYFQIQDSAATVYFSNDTILVRDAANTLALRNSTNAQAFNIYNTYTDASNYERGFVKWDTNVLKIGTEKAGTGTARALEFQTDGTTRLTIADTGAATFSGSITGTTLILGISGVIRVENINNGNNTRTFWTLDASNDVATFATGQTSPIMRFSGATSSFPALKRSSTTLQVRLADDSANAPLESASVKTDAPAGGTSGTWKLGVAATVSPTSPNRTIEVDIGGTIYYIHAKTTND